MRDIHGLRAQPSRDTQPRTKDSLASIPGVVSLVLAQDAFPLARRLFDSRRRRSAPSEKSPYPSDYFVLESWREIPVLSAGAGVEFSQFQHSLGVAVFCCCPEQHARLFAIPGHAVARQVKLRKRELCRTVTCR